MEVICPLANGNGVAYFLAGKFEIKTPMQLKVHASGSCLMVFLRFSLENPNAVKIRGIVPLGLRQITTFQFGT